MLRLLPPALRADGEHERHRVALISFFLTVGVAGPSALARVLTQRELVRELPLLLAAALGVAAFLAYRRWPSLQLTTLRVFWAGLIVLIPATTVLGDGLGSASLATVAIVPIVSSYLLGAADGLRAALGVSGVLGIIAAGALAGALEFPAPAEPPHDELFGVAASLCLVWLSFLVVTIYETQRRHTILALQASDRRYRLALQAEGAGVLEWRPGAAACVVSPRLLDLLGRTDVAETQAIDSLFAALAVVDAGRLRAGFAETSRTGVPFRIETELAGPEAPARILGWDAIAEVDGSTGERRIVAIARDVTEARRLARMKDDFVAAVSHELRTPLTTIRGAVGLLSAGVGANLDADGRQVVELARRGTERLSGLVEDLLDAQRLELGRLSVERMETDVLVVAESAVSAQARFAAERGVSCVVEAETPVPVVLTDPRRLGQVLANLLNNAYKFTRPGGRVVVRVASRTTGVRIAVTDEGPGVPEAFQPHLFERFAQAAGGPARPHGGAGMGLSLARALTRRLGGEIGCESPKGQGATFWVELPGPETAAEAVG